jgi:hypothetical protein
VTALVLALVALFFSQPPAGISGAVINADTKAPVVGARVLLVKTEGRLADARLTATDNQGRFVFAAVPPGTYRLLAEDDDYQRGEPSPPIVVMAGEPVPRVSLALTATTVISGRVTDEFGEPAAKVLVRAIGASVTVDDRTNDLGEYRLFGLAPATYIVSAERYPGPSIQGTFLVSPTPPCPDCFGEGAFRQGLAGLLASGAFIDPRALTGQTYPVVFFPGTTDRAAAGSVKVTPGVRIDGIDLRLVVR